MDDTKPKILPLIYDWILNRRWNGGRCAFCWQADLVWQTSCFDLVELSRLSGIRYHTHWKLLRSTTGTCNSGICWWFFDSHRVSIHLWVCARETIKRVHRIFFCERKFRFIYCPLQQCCLAQGRRHRGSTCKQDLASDLRLSSDYVLLYASLFGFSVQRRQSNILLVRSFQLWKMPLHFGKTRFQTNELQQLRCLRRLLSRISPFMSSFEITSPFE